MMAIAALAGTMMAFSAPHAFGVEPEMVEAAKTVQAACMKGGEDSRVCSCGVGISYSKLDPKVFKLMPKLQPLMAQQDQGAALMGLLQVAQQSGVSVNELQTAYNTIKANKETVNAICKPLVAIKRPQ
jgi:hypothetical protein